MKLSARSGSGCYYSKQLDCLWGKENAFLFRREEKVENLTYETISYFMLLLCYHHMKLSLMRCIRIYFKEISLISALIHFTMAPNCKMLKHS